MKGEITITGQSLDTEKVASLLEGIRDHYQGPTKVFFRYLREHNMPFSPESVLEFADWLHAEHDGRKYKAQTINGYVSMLTHRLRYIMASTPGMKAETRERMERLTDELRKKRQKVGRKGPDLERCMTPDEMQSVIDYARKRNPRIALIAEFLGATGCRISETLQILLSECRPAKAGEVSILVHGKGHKDRTVYVPAEFYKRIRGEFGGRTYLFPHSSSQKLYSRCYVSQVLHRYSERAIGRPISAHVFRHSYVTDQLERFPGKLRGISRYVGHANVQITLDTYLHGDLTAADIASMAPRFAVAQ